MGRALVRRRPLSRKTRPVSLHPFPLRIPSGSRRGLCGMPFHLCASLCVRVGVCVRPLNLEYHWIAV